MILAIHEAKVVSANSGLTYHGRIVKPDGIPLEGDIKFLIQIRSPADQGDCLLYEETQVTKVSKGVFNLTIGKKGVRLDNLAHTFEQAFQSSITLTGLTCEGNSAQTSYQAASTHGRQLKVSFFDPENGWEEIPSTTINIVPFAIESQSLGGFSAKHLLRVVEDGGGEKPKEVSALTESQYDTLMDWLVNGIPGGGGGGGGTSLGDIVQNGSGTSPGNSGDSDRGFSTGNGGSAGSNGSNGRIVITFGG